MNVYLKPLAVKRLKQGNALLTKSDIINGTQQLCEGNIVTLIDNQSQKNIGKAIIGFQNKGIGWVFTTNPKQEFDDQFISQLLEKAVLRRLNSDIPRQSTAYRLFNGESDGLGGMTIDWYNDSAVFSWYSKGMYHYAKRIVSIFLRVMAQQNTTIVSIFEKLRFDNVPYDTMHIYGDNNDYRMIQENGIYYATYLNDGLMTGIFLDQRNVRQYIQQHVNNQTVLNTFSYTAAFSVAAAVGGAKQTTSVDVAKRSVDKSIEHFKLNELDMTTNTLYVMDVFEYFKYANKKQLIFDWVILDPPSFARTKKRTFSVLKNYGELLEQAISLTAPNGRIVVSTNASNFSKKAFATMIDSTFKNNGKRYIIETYFSQPKDFTTLSNVEETAYLKVFIVKLVD